MRLTFHIIALFAAIIRNFDQLGILAGRDDFFFKHQCKRNGRQSLYNDDSLQNQTGFKNGLPSAAIKTYRIVGGTFAQIQDYSFVVSLYYKKEFICGGSIIGKSWVLTAAHCIVDDPKVNKGVKKKLVSVRGNSANRNKNYNSYLVIEAYPHDKYDKQGKDYDICVLKIDRGFTGRYEKPIAFANNNYKYTVCSSATILGWGDLGANLPAARVLMQVQVDILEWQLCTDFWKTLDEKVTNRMVCTYRYKKSGCFGDSGGPLYQNNTLIGIVAFGDESCGDALPPVDVFTKVSRFSSFIRKYKYKN